jgi:poly(3-hydroxybutyrate) depolymerase
VPPACEPAGSKCKLHVFLHGCGVSFSYDVFTKYSGFNEWAMRNNIIILYPKMGTSGPTSQLKSGCFDGYGQVCILPSRRIVTSVPKSKLLCAH